MMPAPAPAPAPALAVALGARPNGFTARALAGPSAGFAAAPSRSGRPPLRDTSAVGTATLDPQPQNGTADPAPLPARYDTHDLECARADAFAAGLDTGRAEAEQAIGASLADCERLNAAIAAARAVDADALAAALAETVCTLVGELLEAQPDLAGFGIEERARTALAALGQAHEPATLWLAPADAAVLAPRLATDAGVAIVPDPTLARGALRLTTRHSRLDDSPAARLERLAAPLADAALLAARAA